jgi:hypothetical protein
MRKLLPILIALAAIVGISGGLAFGQVGQIPGGPPIQPMVGAAPFALDGSVGSGQGSGATVALSSMTTTYGNLVIYVAIASTPTITGVTDTAGNTYTKRVGNAATNNTELWTATAATKRTGNVITVAQSGSTNFTAAAAAFSGAHFAAPFDPNAAIPAFAANATFNHVERE